MSKLIFYTYCFLTWTLLPAQIPAFNWAVKFSGSSTNGATAIAIDASGNVYTTGFFSAPVDFDPGPGTYDLTCQGLSSAFICKLDAKGNFVWARKFDSVSEIFGCSIVVDGSGNVYTIGGFWGTVDFDPGNGVYNLSSIGSDVFISKLDPSGNFIWARCVNGDGSDCGRSIAIDKAGNIYATGWFAKTANFKVATLTSVGQEDIFISKLDPLGNFIWAKNIGSYGYDEGFSIAVDPACNVYITGNFANSVDFDPGPEFFPLTSGGAMDAFISKLDSSGNFVWAKKIGGPGDDFGNSIATDGQGNVYSTGAFSATVDFDPGPGIYNLSSFGAKDIFISKLDSSGNFVWGKNIGGAGSDEGYSIAADQVGNIYSTGIFSSTSDFDPGPGTYYLTATGGFDFFISKLNTSGNFDWAARFGGTDPSYSHGITVDFSGNIFTAGNFRGVTDFDASAGTFTLSCAVNDIFVQRLGASATGIKENINLENVSVYPNPSNNLLNISSSNAASHFEIEIYNCLGEMIRKTTYSEPGCEIDLSFFPVGVYIVKLTEGKTERIQKIIKW